MSAMNLLVELLTEELPPKALKQLGQAFATGLTAGLRTRNYLRDGAAPVVFATPRRLAVFLPDVADTSPDQAVETKLMPKSVALGADGAVSTALRRKLEGLGRAHLATPTLDAADGPDRIVVRNDGKADNVYLMSQAKGQPLARGLQEALDDAIGRLPIPKVMSYAGPGHYFNNEKFVRPAHGLLALHGPDVVPVTALGLAAGRTTQGHRFMSRGAIEIENAESYAPTLEAEGKVFPSFAARRANIVVALERVAGSATPIMPGDLLDEVTALVEWPVVYAGTFDEAFLSVPQECLILTMQLNQRYFALEHDGKLINRFLVVSNIATSDPSAIVAGNERVLRARLADAKFFYDQDRKQTLESRLPKLAGIVYHNKLGSQAQRTERLRTLALRIAPLVGADPGLADRAGALAKADLVTDMVGEFPELQGLMGRYYATHDGEPAEVAAAIEQHYWPKAAGGELPKSPVAQSVALADKLEALGGMFGIGQVPTGDKDPFGLRRAALGIVRILVERRHAVPLSQLVGLAFSSFNAVPGVTKAHAAVLDFIYDRLRGYLRDQGYSANQVAAVLDSRPDVIADLPARLAAVQAFAALPEAAALSAANKRIVNILRKSGSDAAPSVDRERLAEGAEHDLYVTFERLAPQVDGDFGRGDFESALRVLATAKPAVDRYFDDVMVMADDPAIRANRLALLRGVADTMNRVADISKLAS
jgi:glycyl-tRNA synthetase beta chain